MADAPANVIFIHWHDLGRHLSCYGAQGVVSPTLDRMAEEGIRLTDAHATAPLCSPARGSLFTGQYPHRNGLIGLAHHGFGYREGTRTLPSLLGAAGYRTVLIGMQHESTDPTSLGFDTVDVSDSRCDYVTDEAISWLTREGVDDQPFFLTAGFFETHRPYPDDEYDHPDPTTIGVPDFLPDTPDVRADLAGLHGSITKADAAVGRLLDAVARAGLDANTWIVFATDHGVAFPRAKSTLYAEGTGIAMIIRPPNGGPTGLVYDGLFSGVDLAPTLLDLLGQPIPDEADGVSHAGAFRGSGDSPVRDELFTEKTYHDAFDPIRAVRTKDFSYIENYAPRPELVLPLDIADSSSARSLDPRATIVPRARHELYDLRFDPRERNNLAGDPLYTEIAAGLAGRLARWRSETGDELPEDAVGTAVAERFMRAWANRSKTIDPGEEALPSRRPLGARRELAGGLTVGRTTESHTDSGAG
ncbi:sulfatase family protein [Gordonia crocea]|uniref:Putative sulfatase n=1 Tax=Gordonia crocea TaxID=589162 RepID=A0A7I9V2D3_9ACTN|nr:sulfatase [Gordonia crocea]GED99240.1 putative sulfatase [Gordonia crocea]